MVDLPPPPTYELPFPHFQRGQEEAIAAILQAFSQGADLVMLQAPTGSGKSLCGQYVARALGGRSLTTVSTKHLQSQMLTDFRDLVTLKGRGNYPCLIQPGASVDMAPCLLAGLRCSYKHGPCPYFLAKRQAAGAPHLVTNLAYFLAEANQVGGVCSGRNTLVIDEGHLLEGGLLDYLSVHLTAQDLAAFGIAYPYTADTVEAVQAWAQQAFERVNAMWLHVHSLGGSLSSEDAWKRRDNPLRDLKQLYLLREVHRALDTLCQVRPREWFLLQGWGMMTLKPIVAGHYAPELVFSHARRTLIMSATLLSLEVMARQFALDPRRIAYVEMDSAFPPLFRPINYWPVLPMTRHTQDYDPLIRAVEAILDHHSQEKGVIHTVSYRLRDVITSRVRQRSRLISHSPARDGDRDRAFQAFLESNQPLVLVSPSAQIGLDLKGDLGRWQVLLKVPFPDLGDKQVALRQEMDPEWYQWCAAAALIQSSGRVVRSPGDFGVTYILDTVFGHFFRRNRHLFPSWWQQALHPIASLDQAHLPPQMLKRRLATATG